MSKKLRDARLRVTPTSENRPNRERQFLPESVKRWSALSVRTVFLVLFALFLAAFSQSCGVRTYTEEFFAMDTFMVITVYGDDETVELVKEKIGKYDAMFSVSSVTGELARLNETGYLEDPSPELLEMLDCAKTLWERTGGLYDVTAYPLSKLWNEAIKTGVLPEEEQIKEAVGKVGFDKITFCEDYVSLGEAAGIDLGSIVKGYAGREAAKVITESGNAVGAVLNLGGNIVTVGKKPDAEKFRIAITDPFEIGKTIGYLETEEATFSTCGTYNRCVTVDGKTYHHIISTGTGYPCESGLVSVTVIAQDGMWADALSTSLMLLGEDGALEYYENYGGFEAVFVREDGTVFTTDGLESVFVRAQQ